MAEPTQQQRELVYLMQLWRDKFRDHLGWEVVKREAFRYTVKNETLDGFDVHLMGLRNRMYGMPLGTLLDVRV